MPPAYPVSDMGVPDYGGGSVIRHVMGGTGVARLHGPSGPAQATFTLTAAMGRQVIGDSEQPVMTFNGSTPGPTLTVTQGDLVEVHLVNQDVPRGVTIHWHGVDLPGAEDGVAGVTQDAVLPGSSYTYRFVVPDAGTYWYHSHQDSANQVGLGLLGALVVLPGPGQPPLAPADSDIAAMLHTYGTTATLNGRVGSTYVAAPPGARVRVRFVNGANGPGLVTASSPFVVAAIDGTDIPGGTPLTGTYAIIPAGGRADLLVDVGDTGVRVGQLSGPTLVIGPDPAASPPELAATQRFDALNYGAPGAGAQARAQFAAVDRRFTYSVGAQTGFLNGRLGNWFTIDGELIPKVPMFVVREGDVVQMRIVNRTSVSHPMHLHGHHALVVSRDGVPSTGAPWWVDSLEVDPGESFVLLFNADNPGIWMFHCHNLPHASAGLVTHLMYAAVKPSFLVGRAGPGLVNNPE
jgi:FtsP/CotA-like multicopper oxidase with cupredoxin domain